MGTINSAFTSPASRAGIRRRIWRRSYLRCRTFAGTPQGILYKLDTDHSHTWIVCFIGSDTGCEKTGGRCRIYQWQWLALPIFVINSIGAYLYFYQAEDEG